MLVSCRSYDKAYKYVDAKNFTAWGNYDHPKNHPLKIDGSYVDKFDKEYCTYTIMYSNGIVFRDEMNCSNSIVTKDSLITTSQRNDAYNWGAYEIKKDTIFFQFFQGTGPPYTVIVDVGKIFPKEDSIFFFKRISQYGRWLNEEEYTIDTNAASPYLQGFSGWGMEFVPAKKPDSINILFKNPKLYERINKP